MFRLLMFWCINFYFILFYFIFCNFDFGMRKISKMAKYYIFTKYSEIYHGFRNVQQIYYYLETQVFHGIRVPLEFVTVTVTELKFF